MPDPTPPASPGASGAAGTSGAPDLDAVTAAGLAALDAAADLDALRDVEQAHLGRRSALGGIQRSLGDADPDTRRSLGARVNAARATLTAAAQARRAALEASRDAALLEAERLDVTLPGRRPPTGAVHLLQRTTDEVTDIFAGLGYRIAEGPEVETDWYNFQALNFPPDHPARSEQDAVWVTEPHPATGQGTPGVPGRLVLRTHTSPVQIRTMQAACAAARAGGDPDAQPGLYVVVPGRCYRADTPDATHMPVFQQIEVLAVDQDLTMGDMKGTLQAFARAYFGATREIRLRPSYFPFVEPGAEIDVSCFVCDGRGQGCRTCRGEGWIELLGAGMVHPNVLAAGGYDPDRVSGFAAGMGVERLYMLRSGLADMRTIYDNDLRWLASA